MNMWDRCLELCTEFETAVKYTREAERLIGISDWWAERGVTVRFGEHGLGVVQMRSTRHVGLDY